MSSCAKCKKDFPQGQRIIVCNVCSALFHYHPSEVTENCSGLLATEVKALDIKIRNPFLYYKCEFCKKDGRDDPIRKLLLELTDKNKEFEKVKEDFNKFHTEKLPLIEEDFDKLLTNFSVLEDKVNSMEKIIKSFNDLSSQIKSHLSGVTNDFSYKNISEYSARQSKRNNVIIYKFKESIENDLYNQAVDVSNVVNVLSNMKLKTNLCGNNIFRVGKFDVNKIRPVLIKMDVRSDATKVIANWRSLPKEINVSFDFTLDQRAKYKALRSEVIKFNEVNKNQDMYKIIRYKNGEPFILDKFKSKKVLEQNKSTINNLN